MPEFSSVWQYLAWLSIAIVLAQGFRRMRIREAYIASLVRQGMSEERLAANRELRSNDKFDKFPHRGD